MTIPLKRSAYLAEFQCLGAECLDTCCKGWGMQLDSLTREKYEREAPELLAAVDTGEAEWIMKRDPKTDYCIKFDNGLCGIHAKHGTDFLGDACHFYPRATRRLGDETLMTATLSCPEVARLALFQEHQMRLENVVTDRVPASLKDYLPEGMDAAKALAVHQSFLTAAEDQAATPERIMARLVSVTSSMERLDKNSWDGAAAFYLTSADGRLPMPEASIEDTLNLVHALVGLVGASKKTARSRLEKTIEEMVQSLDAEVNWQTHRVLFGENSLAAYQRIQMRWEAQGRAEYDALLRRWIQAQLALSLFPFAGFGNTISERIALMGVRFAILKLALMCGLHVCGVLMSQETVIRIVQSLARFLDHLADPTLSLAICGETGWLREARLRSLIGDV